MPTYSGLLAILAVVLPLVAAAPFVLVAAYIVARLFQTSARERALHAAVEPARPAESFGGPGDSFVCAAESYDVLGAAPLGTVARRMQDEALTRGRACEKLRRTGEGAPARILNLSDTGIRIGNGASLLRFGLEVLPTGRPAFRAETHCAVSDASLIRLTPGSTVNVKFGSYGSPVHLFQ
jgi:hypothetical protein